MNENAAKARVSVFTDTERKIRGADNRQGYMNKKRSPRAGLSGRNTHEPGAWPTIMNKSSGQTLSI